MKNYYGKIIRLVENKIAQNQLQEALFLLEDELKTPYIPLEYEEVLADKYRQLKADLAYFQKIKPYETSNQNELFELIFSAKGLNETALALFFERFKQRIQTKQMLVFLDFLVAKTNKVNAKHFLLLCLKDQPQRLTINYFNPFLDRFFKFNNNDIAFFNELSLYQQTKQMLMEMTWQEPSLNVLAKDLLKSVYLYYFPKQAPLQAQVLAHALLEYIMVCFNNTTQIQNMKNHQLLKKIILAVENHINT